MLTGDSTQASHLPEFDTLTSQFYAATGATRDAIYNDATTLTESIVPAAKHYVRVMEKVVNDSETYVEKEMKCLVSILSKHTLAPTKLDEIKIKANILGAFTPLKEKVDDVLGRDSANL